MEEQLQRTEKSFKKRNKKAYVFSLIAVAVIGVVAVIKFTGSNNKVATAPPVTVIRITGAGFEPATVHVRQGATITWTNTDKKLHQVVSNPYPTGTDLSSLKSEILNNDQTYTYKADAAGTFGYHDQLKPTINGTLVVEKR
jgi:plastocyanin